MSLITIYMYHKIKTHIMKFVFYTLIAFSLFISSCSNNYYKYIIDKSCAPCCDPRLSFFITFSLTNDSLESEYLMPSDFLIGIIKEDIYNIQTKTTREIIINQLKKNNGKLDLTKNDFDSDFNIDDYIVNHSNFIDSLNLLTSDKILARYFEKGLYLNTTHLTIDRVYDIIYVLTKRKEYISIYYSEENDSTINMKIFYGKIYRKNHVKMHKNIVEFL